MSKLEILLDQYTELTIVHVNGKLYIEQVQSDGTYKYFTASSVHIAMDEEDLVNELIYPPATPEWSPNYYYDELDWKEREI